MSKLKISQMTYKRIHNLGNYETHSLEVTTTVNEKDDPDKIYRALKSFVEDQLFN